MTRPQRRLIAIALSLALSSGAARADERESLETLRATTLGLIKALVQQGVISQDKADDILRQATAAAQATAQAPAATAGSQALPTATASGEPTAAAQPTPPGQVRVPYVPEVVRRQLREEIRNDVLAEAKAQRWADPGRLPEWLDRLNFSGEMTLRWQDDLFRRQCNSAAGIGLPCNAEGTPNPFNGLAIPNTSTDRQRLRLRALEGVSAKVNDQVDAAVVITTGTTSASGSAIIGDPNTNFQTLGNSFSRPLISLDRGYLNYRPQSWLSLTGGRFANPFLSTDLVWNSRLGFDGAYANAHSGFGQSGSAFAIVGAFPIQDIDPTPSTVIKSKWMYGTQLGAGWDFEDHSSARFGLAYYRFTHVEGQPVSNPSAPQLILASQPQLAQKGNSLIPLDPGNLLGTANPTYFGLASQFREVEATAAFDLARFEPIHLNLTLDAVRNVGFDQNEIALRSGGNAIDPSGGGLLRPRVTGYGARLTLGMPRLHQTGDWQTWFAYKYLERDAVLDAYVDPDFHLGGTDAKGWIAYLGYDIARDTWISLKYLSSASIDGPPLNIDVLQADFNIRF